MAFKVYLFVPLNQLIYFLGEYIGDFSNNVKLHLKCNHWLCFFIALMHQSNNPLHTYTTVPKL